MLPNAMEVRERCLAKPHWDFGLPYRKETWPGMRAADALLPEELERVEAWVKEKTGASRLWAERPPRARSSTTTACNWWRRRTRALGRTRTRCGCAGTRRCCT